MLNEGLCDWRRDRFQQATLQAAREDGLLGDPILDWAEQQITAQPPSLRLHTTGYAVGANAVRYVVAERGRLEAYWALADRCAATRDLDRGAADIFGQRWADFQASYRAWLDARLDS